MLPSEREILQSSMPRYRRGLRPWGDRTEDAVFDVQHAPLPKGIKTSRSQYHGLSELSSMPRYRRGLRQRETCQSRPSFVQHAPLPKGIKTYPAVP